MAQERRYYVYVIELDDSKRKGAGKPALYVGHSVREPEVRFDQHLNGVHASHHVRGHAVRLRWDLFADYNPMATRPEAEEREKWLADRLEAEGHRVYSA
jgi:predicted GIY-YIG superfamily endonuclease